LEQLLWHITSLEALLGDNAPGLNDRLARRIASINGKTAKERNSIKKKVKELYTFRSDLVHGNKFEKQVYVGHLYNARVLARQTLLWFLNCLKNIVELMPKTTEPYNIPTREDLLRFIDLDKRKRIRQDLLNKVFPTEFPYKQDWLL
jgi:hypothetical protein